MSFSKTLGTIVVTALVGSATFLVTSPKKLVKNKLRAAKTTEQNGIEDKENLFI
ncbi:hypothetical protein [Marinoscillum pacificum]|uniref:hypothetical protein n=1 Tax=Marinoscillum pacificum TaxID=392723 RepID=UPI002158133F|nr:hypothetical protein [Marinoscillum pacificum]